VLVTLTECTAALPKSAKDVLYQECMAFLKTFDTTDLTPAFDLSTMSAAAVTVTATAVPPPPPQQQQRKEEKEKEEKEDMQAEAVAVTLALPSQDSDFRPVALQYLLATSSHFSGMLDKHGEPPAAQLDGIASSLADRLGALLLWHEAAAGDVEAVRECLAGAGWDVRGRTRALALSGGASLSLEVLLAALSSLGRRLSSSSSSNSSGEGNGDGGPAALKRLSLEVAEPDSTIACWYTLEHYTEAVLGVGIALVRGKVHTTLSTDGELLSIGAFEVRTITFVPALYSYRYLDS
jgi:hypothetical protein